MCQPVNVGDTIMNKTDEAQEAYSLVGKMENKYIIQDMLCALKKINQLLS